MVTTTDVLTRDALQRHVRERAEKFDIPDRELEVNTYHDSTRGDDVVRVHFRTPDKMEKYGGEMAINLDMVSGSPQMDIVGRQLDDLLAQLESQWLSNGGSVTFYRGHGFFYRLKRSGPKACLEIQCTVCSHVELINKSTSTLEKYQDVFLMAKLPKVHAECDCAGTDYDRKI